MKNYFYLLIFIVFGLFSCDKVENPIPPVFGDVDWSLYPGDSNDYLTLYNFDNPETNWSTNYNTKKYILLEDYTGHKCTNCPDAAIIAEQLEDDTSLNVILVAIHASPDGSFQATDDVFIDDFTTEAGDTYVTEMPGMFANPMGTINRKNTGLNNSVWHLVGSWENAVNQENNQVLLANIQIKKNHFASTNGLFIHTETEFKSDMNGNYHLVIFLIRNSVIAPQKMSNGSTNYNYNHHSVLTDNINGVWGTEISSSNVSSGSKFYNDFSFELIDPSIDSSFNIDNLSLITLLFERNTFEVIQVIKTNL